MVYRWIDLSLAFLHGSGTRVVAFRRFFVSAKNICEWREMRLEISLLLLRKRGKFCEARRAHVNIAKGKAQLRLES